jgi:MEMO1 family protein
LLATRPAAVAGTFYPAEPEQLRFDVERLLTAARRSAAKPKALIAPHAGYIYSGAVAASAYATLADHAPEITKVILLGPCHRVPVRGIALSPASSFSTPLGTVTLATDTQARLGDLPYVMVSTEAHAAEHSLEVHLPFLQMLLGEFTLTPLLVGSARPEEVAQVLSRFDLDESTLLIVSTDLSHYLDYASARRLDAATSHAIENRQIDLGPQQACGCAPLSGLLLFARQHDWHVQTLDLRNSGDTAGPRHQVVGYGAYALYG